MLIYVPSVIMGHIFPHFFHQVQGNLHCMLNFPYDVPFPGLVVAQVTVGGNLVDMVHTAHTAEGNGHDQMVQEGG